MASTTTTTSSSSGAVEPRPPPPKPALLVVRPLSPAFAAALSARFRVLDFHSSTLPLPAFLASAAAAGDDSPRAALVRGGGSVQVNATFLSAAPSLRCVVTTSAGVDHVDLAECARRGVAAAFAGTVYSAVTAESAVGLLLDVLRRVSAADRYVRRGLWPKQGDYPLGSKVGGKRVGIVGLGSIGAEIAKRLVPFGCIICYYSRTQKPSFPYKYFPTVCDLAAHCDVVVVSCALTKETHHIIDRDVMLALGKDGVIINIGRGALIDELELVRALKDGEIGGAGLDVFENEPFVPELFSMDNVVLTPHQAVHTPEAFSDMNQLMVANLEAFFANKPLVTPISD